MKVDLVGKIKHTPLPRSIPHDAIAENMTLQGLASQFVVRS